jgi:hypothetical protein
MRGRDAGSVVNECGDGLRASGAAVRLRAAGRWMEREYHHVAEASKPADSDTGSKAKAAMDEASLPVYSLAEVRVGRPGHCGSGGRLRAPAPGQGFAV